VSTASDALSTLLYNKIDSKLGTFPKIARKSIRYFTDAFAEGLLEYFTSAGITVTIQITQGGLQTISSALPGEAAIPTGAPFSPVTLTGSGRFDL